jgi:hypothetical protein
LKSNSESTWAANRLSRDERLAELAQILARGFLRMKEAKTEKRLKKQRLEP